MPVIERFMKPQKILINNIPHLTMLFDYHDVDKMIAENTVKMLLGEIDIFVIYDLKRLVAEIRVMYQGNDKCFCNKRERAYLYALRVHKDYQRKGLATKLMQYAIEHLQLLGYKEVTVGVEDNNDTAKRLYSQFGFTKTIARLRESYQGDLYEFDLIFKKIL